MASLTLSSPSSVKELSDSITLPTIPQIFVSRIPEAPRDFEPIVEEEIPAIDFDLLVNGAPDERSQVVRELGKACEDWGFFMVVNHGVPAKLRDSMMDAFKDLFGLTAEEKGEYLGRQVLDPIRIGTSFNSQVEDVMYWRDYVKIFVHPVFHSPNKPPKFREISKEYTACTRVVGMELLKGIWNSLGLDDSQMGEALNLDSCFQILASNLYPPCPQPELAMGLPSHSDHGLLTILYQNGVNGLQVKHKGNWVHVKPLPDSYLVNTGDHMEIVSNGRYRSVLHRAVVSGESTRMSIVSLLGPNLDAVVEPSPHLVSIDRPLAYRGIKYGDFMEQQQSSKLKDKSVLDLLRLHVN
ncbi:2-oxoglutarate-dependent dioxygenase 19-like [Typha latifolia]|uniref:2-oxoglutarate-dependent dioxygenase 19-like n=1 Tax=Typha latifolia TaxID=4733 RepID=UPI003C2C2F7F